MSLAWTRYEVTIANINPLNATSGNKERFPRPRGVRSLYFFCDMQISVGTTGVEVAGVFEVLNEIEIEWDGKEAKYYGRQIPLIHQDWWGKPVVVEEHAYMDHAGAAGTPGTGSSNMGGSFRLPVGAPPMSNKNIDITISTWAVAAWAEATTNIDATAPDLDIYIGADYVNETPSHSYVTWTDVREALNSQVDVTPPFISEPGTSIEKIYITTTDDRDDWVPEATQGNRNALSMNYENNLQDFELDMGLAETWDLTSVIDAFLHPTLIVRAGDVDDSATVYENVLARTGDYVIPVNQEMTSEFRLRVNATTTDAYFCVVYAVPNAVSSPAAVPAPSVPVTPGGPATPVAGGVGGVAAGRTAGSTGTRLTTGIRARVV